MTKYNISNEEFLRAIFGEKYQSSHVTSFTQDPTSIPSDQRGLCWSGGYYKDMVLKPKSNQFYTVSLFSPDETGKAVRRKENFTACYMIALDDVREKLPIAQVNRLPKPSIVLKSSLYSEQWLFLLITPECNPTRIDNLHDGLISNGLAPDSKDPGQKGITRYLRLPEGYNTKAKRIEENNGTPPKCEIIEWHPERRYTLEELAKPFSVDLDAPRTNRAGSLSSLSDHPLLNTPAIHIKKEISNGKYDITCPWLDNHTNTDDSGTAIFTASNGDIGFKCHHGHCEELTGNDLLNFIEAKDHGFKERLKKWQLVNSFGKQATYTETSTPISSSPLQSLLSNSANGKSKEMRLQMMTDKFILKDIAILGQWTVLYAGPNTGKTLLTIWLLREAITSNQINGNNVIYANCDDFFKGSQEKLEIAEDIEFHMLLPSVNNFKTENLLNQMQAMVESNEARGIVIILDTLKKFTDLMDKRIASKFGKVARLFVSSGGSLICLAHVNKNKDMNGKSIYAGTSDITDDSDCVYIIDTIDKNETPETSAYTIEFSNIKSRGDVGSKLGFRYKKSKGDSYNDVLNSIERIDQDSIESILQQANNIKQRKEDSEVIEQIRTAITNNQINKAAIEKFISTTYQTPRNTIRSVLERYEKKLWQYNKGAHNTYIYSLLDAPKPPISFL